jgi:hypothetical protein
MKITVASVGKFNEDSSLGGIELNLSRLDF